MRSNLTLKCPNCGQDGFVAWDDDDSGGPRRLAHVSEGFHQEAGRAKDSTVLLVCNACDQILEA